MQLICCDGTRIEVDATTDFGISADQAQSFGMGLGDSLGDGLGAGSLLGQRISVTSGDQTITVAYVSMGANGNDVAAVTARAKAIIAAIQKAAADGKESLDLSPVPV